MSYYMSFQEMWRGENPQQNNPFFLQADKDIIVIYSCASVHQLEAHCRRC